MKSFRSEPAGTVCWAGGEMVRFGAMLVGAVLVCSSAPLNRVSERKLAAQTYYARVVNRITWSSQGFRPYADGSASISNSVWEVQWRVDGANQGYVGQGPDTKSNVTLRAYHDFYNGWARVWWIATNGDNVTHNVELSVSADAYVNGDNNAHLYRYGIEEIRALDEITYFDYVLGVRFAGCAAWAAATDSWVGGAGRAWFYTNGQSSQTSGDSGFGWSYRNQYVVPGGTRTLGVLIGLAWCEEPAMIDDSCDRYTGLQSPPGWTCPAMPSRTPLASLTPPASASPVPSISRSPFPSSSPTPSPQATVAGSSAPVVSTAAAQATRFVGCEGVAAHRRAFWRL